MERFLASLPSRPQPLWIRIGVTLIIMALSALIQMGPASAGPFLLGAFCVMNRASLARSGSVRPIAEIRQSNDRADQQENHDSWNFQSARQPWSSLKLLRRPTGEKNQPIYGASVSCVTDDFVVCRQAERVKVFFLPLTPAGFFLAGFFMSRLSSPWSKVRCRLVR
jgi:hypothetical protein